MEEEGMPHLPLDIMYKIFEHISDPASLARAALSCKWWRDIIKDSTFLDGLNKRHLLLGFFYQCSAEAPENLWKHHRDKSRCLAPRFRPASQLLQFTGHKYDHISARPLSLGTFMQDIGSSLNFYEPVASQDNFLVLCYHSQDGKGNPRPDAVRVCNPLTGLVFCIPDLAYVPPDHYALLVTNDVDINGRRSQSFQLVAVWIKGKKFIYFYYCSKTSAWWRSASTPELLPGLYIASSPAAASHGRIHWLCGSWKSWALSHVVTLHVSGEVLSYVELPSEAKCGKTPLIAKSSDGGLLLILMKGLQMLLWKHNSESGSGSSSWVLSETISMTSFLPFSVLKMRGCAKIRLEIFRGRSGVVVFWIEGEGLFSLSLIDRSMRKVDNVHVTKKYGFCPYEVDWLSCLAVTNLVDSGSLSHDAEREKAQRRWRSLVANVKERIMEDDVMLHLPMDIIYKILSHISDPASLARLASSCKFWRQFIKDTSFLDGLKKQRHTHGFSPSLLLGFFYQDNIEPPSQIGQHDKDKLSCWAPRFMPMSELSQFIGSKAGKKDVGPLSLCTFIRGIGAKFNFYEPIASQDGLLALCHRLGDVPPYNLSYASAIPSPMKSSTYLLSDLNSLPGMPCLSPRMSVMMASHPSPLSCLPSGSKMGGGSSLGSTPQRLGVGIGMETLLS